MGLSLRKQPRLISSASCRTYTLSSVGSPESSATTPRTTTFTSPVYTWAREHEQVPTLTTNPRGPACGVLQLQVKNIASVYGDIVRYTDVLLLKILIMTCVAIKNSWFTFMQMFSQRFSRSVKLLCADTNGISKPQTTLG